MTTAIGIVIYTFIILSFAGNTEIEAKDDAIVINNCIIKEESY